MSTLTLKGLRYEARHGFYEQEREHGNRFEVDLVFTADLSEAARTDDLATTLDYERAEALVYEVMHGQPLHLIEALAQRIGDKIFAAFPRLQALEVRLRKLSPPIQTKCQYTEIVLSWPQ